MLKILISTICLACASCETKTAYHYYQSIPSNGWEQTDTLIFHFPTSLVSHDYMLCFGIRHLQNYLYKDIWLAMSTPSMQHPDTIHMYTSVAKMHPRESMRSSVGKGILTIIVKDNSNISQIEGLHSF